MASLKLNKNISKVDEVGLRNSLSVWYLQNILKKAKYPLQIGDLIKFLDEEDRAKNVIKAGKDAIDKWKGYTHSNGSEEVRRLISKYWFENEEKYNNIIITNGATGGAYLMAWAIKPKKVAIPLYSYPTWFTSVYKEGGKILNLERDKENQISAKAINKINKEIDYIVVIPFDNPTGAIITTENIMKLIKRLKKIREREGKTIPLVLDMEYYDLVFNKKAEEVLKEYNKFGKEWLVIYSWSLSKSIGGPEWRSGFIAVDYPSNMEEGKELVNALSIANSDSLGINISAQFMLKEAIRDFLKKGETFKKREKVRKKVAKRVLKNYRIFSRVKGLKFLGIPKTAFYSIIFLDNTKPWKNKKLKEKIWEKFREKAIESGKAELWEKTFSKKDIKNYSLSEVYALDLAIETGIIVVPYGRFNLEEDKHKIGFRVVIPHKEELIKKCAKEWEEFHKKRFD